MNVKDKDLIIIVENNKTVQMFYKIFFHDIHKRKIIQITDKKSLKKFLKRSDKFDKIDFVILNSFLSKRSCKIKKIDTLKAIKIFKEKSEAIIIATSSDFKSMNTMIENGADKKVDKKIDLIDYEEINKLINFN